jgi:hypothetical protein
VINGHQGVAPGVELARTVERADRDRGAPAGERLA